jgi:pimeloyl-ACP methyl ester carboxylesterase
VFAPAASLAGVRVPGFAGARDRDQRHHYPRSRGRLGPAVVLLHGYGETGDMWVPLRCRPCPRPHRRRSRPARHGPLVQAEGGFDKKNQAEDVDGVLAALGVQQADVVAHDIGNMVAFQFAVRHPDRVRRWS